MLGTFRRAVTAMEPLEKRFKELRP
jgi:hypothetical protein